MFGKGGPVSVRSFFVEKRVFYSVFYKSHIHVAVDTLYIVFTGTGTVCP